MFDCCKRLKKKKEYNKIKENNTYFSPYDKSYTIKKECRCFEEGPPAIETCDVCGAWKTY